MANAFTSTVLLASLKRRGLIPTSTSTFAEADFFKVVDDETQTYIVPLLSEVREEYLVATKDITLVAGTTEYAIPERAIAGKLRDVTLSDGNGAYTPLTRLEADTVHGYTTSTGSPGTYYLRGNKICLIGSNTGTLRVHYYLRPNRIVSTSAVGEIVAITPSTGLIGLSAVRPTTFTTLVTYDLVKGKSGFDTHSLDLTPTAVGASSVTFTPADLPSALAVGDYVCLSQETPIAQIPVELHPLLAQRVTATMLHALGDAKAEAAYKVAADMEARVLKLLSPRAEGSSRVIVNKYGVGRSRRGGW